MTNSSIRFCVVVALLWLSCSLASAQQYKLFEIYRHFQSKANEDESSEMTVNVAIDLDSDAIDRKEAVAYTPSKTIDAKLAYDNHHRNQIATLDPNQPLLPPTENTLTTGLFHTCVITKRTGVDEETCGGRGCGPVKCWGHNDSGQSSPPPGVVFTQISAGGYFTCGIKVEGEIVCWGEIDKALKSRNHVDESKPKQADSDDRHKRRLDKSEYKDEIMRRKNLAKEQHTQSLFSPNGAGKHIQVSSGMKHACALARDLTVHCWGRNDFGESTPPSGKFVQVSYS